MLPPPQLFSLSFPVPLFTSLLIKGTKSPKIKDVTQRPHQHVGQDGAAQGFLQSPRAMAEFLGLLYYTEGAHPPVSVGSEMLYIYI